MLAELASGLVLLTSSQEPPAASAPDDPPALLGDVDVVWRPETVLCVRAERPSGSRIQGAGECRAIAEWRTIQVARAQRYVVLMKHRGAYSTDSSLEEEALGRTVRITLREPTDR